VVSDILRLLHALKDEIPSSSLLQLSAVDSLSNAYGPLKFALNFYGLDTQIHCNDTRTAPQLPFVTAFQDILSISAVCATAMTTSGDYGKTFRDPLVQALSLFNELVTATTLEREQTPTIDWNPPEWISCLMAALKTEVGIVSRSISPLHSPRCLFFQGYDLYCCRPSDNFACLITKCPWATIGFVD